MIAIPHGPRLPHPLPREPWKVVLAKECQYCGRIVPVMRLPVWVYLYVHESPDRACPNEECSSHLAPARANGKRGRRVR